MVVEILLVLVVVISEDAEILLVLVIFISEDAEILVLVVSSEEVRRFVVVFVVVFVKVVVMAVVVMAVVVIAVVDVFQVVVVFIPWDVVLVLVHVFTVNEVLLGAGRVVCE